MTRIFSLMFVAGILTVSAFVSCNKDRGSDSGDDGDKEIATTSMVYDAGTDDHIYFRIPALIETTQKTLLAFCEARNTSVDFYESDPSLFPAEAVGSGDYGNIDLVLKRSTDGGKTWGEMIYVADDRDNTCGNPVPVVDPDTGRIHLFWCWQQYPTSSVISDIYSVLPDSHTRRVMYCYSDDDGLTWSEYQDLSSDLYGDGWTWYATGPCHGIIKTLEPYKGRIIIPANHNYGSEYYSHCVYSDDKGVTWKLGGTTGIWGNESCAVELEDGNIMLMMRDAKGGCRATTVSTDGGDTWGDYIRVEELIDPGCQGSVINYLKDGVPSNILLVTNVHNASTRKNLAVSKSEDSGVTWTTPFQYWHGVGGYSDICLMSDGSIALLYENGTGKYGTAKYYEHINFYKLQPSLVPETLGL